MVDLALLQSVSYIAGALGVCVAAFYYLIVIREQTKNRRITQTHALLQLLQTKEGNKQWIELMNMDWRDYSDFEKKYGSDNNQDNFAMRNTLFRIYDSLGYLAQDGLVDLETVYKLNNIGPIWTWEKFRDIIEQNRVRYTGADDLKGFEYLADEILKIKLRRDPSYKTPRMFARYVEKMVTQ